MKKKSQIRYVSIYAVITLFIWVSIVPSIIGEVSFDKNLFYEKTTVQIDKTRSANNDTEYWALIFAVGIYYKHPEQNIPSMLACADSLYEVLIDSPNWQEDHIHKVTGEKATGRRLIRELLWLKRNDDSDDISLVYITTHGGPLYGLSGGPVDRPPKDEEDGFDEALAMYHGFEKWYALIWDDLLNFLLSILTSEGVCLIVDSCYAGGFNDEPMLPKNTIEDYTAESFSQGFAKELASQGRVILMGCEEHEVTYGSQFSEFLIDGFSGQADIWGNNDGINSAEEAFGYTLSQIWEEQHPTIVDLYSGELPVTYI